MLWYPNAKINIGLRIIEKRKDGYHNIETVFYPIKICDTLDIEVQTNCDTYCFKSSGIKIPNDAEKNLVVRAYRLLQKHYTIPPVTITLRKEIPLGAGLGGGSADGAFMLKALNELFQLHLTNNTLENFASQLGADCAFFVNNQPVYATGIGNVFTPIQLPLEGKFLVLVKPDIASDTSRAYASILPKKPDISLYELIQQPIDRWKDFIINDFEHFVFSQYPVVGEIKDTLYQLGATYVSMSGSGTAVYGLFTQKPIIHNMFDKYFCRICVLG